MIHDDIELSIRWSAETEDLGNEVWCSKPAADAILRLAKQKERLESRIQKLEAVADAAKAEEIRFNESYCTRQECEQMASAWSKLNKALEELERE